MTATGPYVIIGPMIMGEEPLEQYPSDELEGLFPLIPQNEYYTYSYALAEFWMRFLTSDPVPDLPVYLSHSVLWTEWREFFKVIWFPPEDRSEGLHFDLTDPRSMLEYRTHFQQLNWVATRNFLHGVALLMWNNPRVVPYWITIMGDQQAQDNYFHRLHERAWRYKPPQRHPQERLLGLGQTTDEGEISD